MTFWIRHSLLILLCVVLPLGAAFYFDTESEIARSQAAGAQAAKSGAQALASKIELVAHDNAAAAISLSQTVSSEQLLSDLESRNNSKKKAAQESLATLITKGAPEGGFAWFIDAEGRILFRNGGGVPAEDQKFESILGHPLFEQTQIGFALDAIWQQSEGVAFVGAAPVLKDGAAFGAVFVGRPAKKSMITEIASNLGADVTMVYDGKIQITTLKPETAKIVVAALKDSSTPVIAGRLDKPLKHNGYLPFLPVLIDRHADGLAYATMQVRSPGQKKVRWVLSVRSASDLGAVGQRQEVIIGGLLASLLLALLVGLVNHRTFVSPIKKVAQHLSDLQQGRGEMEMPEGAVSRPFRRLVRLINMTVQKMPARSFSTTLNSGDLPLAATPPVSQPNTSDLLNTGSLGEPEPISTIPKSDVSLPAPDLSSLPHSPSADLGAPKPDGVLSSDLQSDLSLLEPPKASAPPPSSPPGLPDATEPFTASAGGNGDEAAAVAEAIASMTLPPTSPGAGDDHASAIAEAIASLDGGGNKQGSEVRGRPMGSSAGASDVPTPFDADGAVPTQAGVVRGGGSLELNTYAGVPAERPVEREGFTPEETVVAPVQEDLLAKSAREDYTDMHQLQPNKGEGPDMTVVATVPADLLAQSAGAEPEPPPPPPDTTGLDEADREHFKDVYDRFIEMRKRCGEPVADLAFERFLSKLTKNRLNLIKKYSCRTVRFQVYEKGGKAALKATPVRAR